MGFDELWDGFEKIKTRTEDGLNFTQAILKYLQRRHELELKYSRNLQSLNECFKNEWEIGTMQNCWHGLRDETQSLSDVRVTFCKDLEEMTNTITNNLKEDKKGRVVLVTKGEKLVSDLAKTEEVMKKARAKYVDARKKQDRAQEGVQKAKASGSSVTKLQKAAEKDERRADKSDNEYRISVNNLKVAQDKFYDTDMPALLREFEQFEDKRLQVTRDYFNTVVEKQAPLGPHWGESNERFHTKVREINIRSDLDLYVERNRPESDQPPPRAQYISYDGSVVQDVVGGAGTTPAVPAKKAKKDSLLPKLPGGKKKKDPAGEKPSVPAEKPKPPPAGGNPTTPSSNISSPPTEPAPTPYDHDSSADDNKPHPEHTSTTTVFNPPKQLVTIYSYDATEENELSFAEGETIYLLEKDDSGWWRGRNAEGQEGLVPSNFVEVVGEEGISGSVEIPKDFKALYDYEAEDETELTIKEGEILHVLSETDGWYFGTNAQGKEGNFPSNFVEHIESHKRNE